MLVSLHRDICAGLETFLPLSLEFMRVMYRDEDPNDWFWKYNPNAKEGEVGVSGRSVSHVSGVLLSSVDQRASCERHGQAA